MSSAHLKIYSFGFSCPSAPSSSIGACAVLRTLEQVSSPSLYPFPALSHIHSSSSSSSSSSTTTATVTYVLTFHPQTLRVATVPSSPLPYKTAVVFRIWSDALGGDAGSCDFAADDLGGDCCGSDATVDVVMGEGRWAEAKAMNEVIC